MMAKQKGFTLIELLVVIAIIGIAGGIIAVNVDNFYDHIESVLDNYVSNTTEFVDNSTDLDSVLAYLGDYDYGK